MSGKIGKNSVADAARYGSGLPCDAGRTRPLLCRSENLEGSFLLIGAHGMGHHFHHGTFFLRLSLELFHKGRVLGQPGLERGVVLFILDRSKTRHHRRYKLL
jgi:hypothetical protein